MKAKVSLKDNSSWLPKNIVYSKEDLLFYPSNELIEMILQLQSNWNSLREWLEKVVKLTANIDEKMTCKNALDKMNELESGDK